MGDVLRMWPRDAEKVERYERALDAHKRAYGSAAWQTTRDAFGRAVADRLFPEGKPEDAA